MEGFRALLESIGCSIEVTQEDDGSGYEVWEVTLPDQTTVDVTVTA